MSSSTGWQTVELGELLKFSNGINAGKSAYGRGIPFANILEVINNESITVDDIPGRVSLPSEVLDRYRVRRGDILFNRTSETQEEVGLTSVYLDDEPIVFGGFVFRGRPITDRLDVSYSKYALRGPAVRRQITSRGQGGIRANVGQRDLKSVRVAVPGKPEQRAIATMLDEASASVRALEKLIAKKRDIALGIMQGLLSGRTRDPSFTDKWRRLRLGEVLTVRHGKSQKGVQSSTGRYPILATGGQIGWAHTPLYTEPSVLIGRKGTIDRPQFQSEPFWTVDTLFYTEISPAADPRFLYYLFLGIDWRSLNEASGVPSLSSTRIEGVEVTMPGLPEQRAIRMVLDDAGREVHALSRWLESARAVKAGLQQQLLSGGLRLPVEEVSR